MIDLLEGKVAAWRNGLALCESGIFGNLSFSLALLLIIVWRRQLVLRPTFTKRLCHVPEAFF